MFDKIQQMRPPGTHYEFELRELCNYLRQHGCPMGVMLEVGSYLGESTLIFAEYFRQVYAVDAWGLVDQDNLHEPSLWPAIEQGFDDNICNTPAITKVKGESTQVAARWNTPLDFVYIDGAHVYEAVIADIRAWRPHAKRIGGHDYDLPGVRRAVDEVFGGAAEIRVFQGSGWLSDPAAGRD